MTNAYGVPGEVGGWPPSEAQEVECPYCRGVNTERIGYTDAQTLAVYICHDCEVEFVDEIDIPY